MPIDIGKELALPLDQLIGGPLQAVVKAQALAASSTVDFIQKVCLTGTAPNLTANTVKFSFTRNRVSETDTIQTETVNLDVPLMTLVPIPFIRVEEAVIDLEVKVSSATLNQTDSSLGVSAEASGGFFGVKFKINASYSRQTKNSDQINKEATLSVRVKAVQDEIPAGMAKVLDILTTAVNDLKATPAPAPTP